MRRLCLKMMIFSPLPCRTTSAVTDAPDTPGAPMLDGASVSAEVVRHGRGEKIIIFKHKRRKNYRRKQGHRQGFTEVRVNEISLG